MLLSFSLNGSTINKVEDNLTYQLTAGYIFTFLANYSKDIPYPVCNKTPVKSTKDDQMTSLTLLAIGFVGQMVFDL